MFHSPEYIAAENRYQKALFDLAAGRGSVVGVVRAAYPRHRMRQKFSAVAQRQSVVGGIEALRRAGKSFGAWEREYDEWKNARDASGKAQSYIFLTKEFKEMACDKHRVAPYDEWMQDQSHGLTTELFLKMRSDILKFYSGFPFKDSHANAAPSPRLSVSPGAVKELSQAVRFDMGLDHNRLTIGEVKHPMALGGRDHVYLGLNTAEGAKDIVQYIYSVLLHEYGHALLRQNVDVMTNAAIDESIAMFFDLAIGRTEAAAHYITDLLINTGVEGVDRDAIVAHLTSRQPMALRAHADPLTYMPAVFLSAAFEEASISHPARIPHGLSLWDKLSRQYGVSYVMHEAGPVQDMQPFTGETCGRLPGYAIGAVMAFQLFEQFDADVGIEWQVELAKGNFDPIVGWLKKNVFPNATLGTPRDFMIHSIGQDISTEAYKREMELRYGA